MRMIGRFFGFLFATGAILFVIGAVAVAAVIYSYSKDLPDTAQLKNYEPPVMTRVHAGDGSILAEYSRERRLYLPSYAIPPLVKQAYERLGSKPAASEFLRTDVADLRGRPVWEMDKWANPS